MSQDKRFDLVIKKSKMSRHSLCLGYFPSTFKGNPKEVQMEHKDGKAYAREEVEKKRKVIKLGNIHEESAGTQTQQYEGKIIGGSNKNQVVIYYENKQFFALPIDDCYAFKKQMINIDSGVKEELQNFSNDPEYGNRKRKIKKSINKGAQVVEQFSEQARKDGGLEEGDKKEEIISKMRSQKEKKNKEDLDFDENDEVYHDNEDDDKAQDGLDFIPDDDSEGDDIFNLGNAKDDKVKLKQKNNALNEDGANILKLTKRNQSRIEDSDSDDNDIGDGSDLSEESDDSQQNRRDASESKVNQKGI